MKRIRLRSHLLTAAIVLFAIAAWVYLAPTRIGGSTTYVITKGISMEPRFHTGDLALVRPANQYKIGEIVAYHSTLLHVIVLHRIIAIHGDRYTFKGDNNHFIDPVHPTRADLVGTLWLHVPGGGRLIAALHTPLIAAAVTAGAALLLLFGAREQRRRRGKRRRNGPGGSGRQGASIVNMSDHNAEHPVNFRAILAGAAAAAAACLVLTVVAFTQPLHKATTVKVPYTLQGKVGYSASAPPGPVYPTGVVRTGDPVFLQLVHQLRVNIDYRLTTAAPHKVTGAEQLLLTLKGPTGWKRVFPAGSVQRFTGDRAGAHVTLDIPSLQSLLAQIQKQTGVPAAGGYIIAVSDHVHIRGLLAGQPINASFSPGLSLGLAPLQLEVGAAPAGAGNQLSQRRTVATAGTAATTLGVAGHSLSVATIRWIALVGLLLCAGVAGPMLVLLRRTQPFGEATRIQTKYGNMIVPITARADLGWPPVDVPSIKALARLAECSGQLILHSQDDTGDTYLVNDEGTVYRYQVQLPKVVWGEWSAPTTEFVA